MKTRIIGITVFGITVFGIVSLILSSRVSETAVEANMRSKLLTIGDALMDYSSNNGGIFPESMAALERDYFTHSNLKSGEWVLFVDPSSGLEYRWNFLCFGKSKIAFSPQEIIAESPIYNYRNANRKIILKNSGEVEIVVNNDE